MKMVLTSVKKRRSLTAMIREYNDYTSLHGPKYITEDGQKPYERILWIIVLITAASFGLALTYRIVNKWQNSPVITTLDSTNYALNKIAFPAVTICPNVKGIKAKVVNEMCRLEKEMQKNGNASRVNHALFSAIAPLLNIGLDYDDPYVLDQSVINTFTNISQTVSFIKKISPRCKDYIKHCWWQNKLQDCAKIFRTTPTDIGFCCSFNIVPPLENLNEIG